MPRKERCVFEPQIAQMGKDHIKMERLTHPLWRTGKVPKAAKGITKGNQKRLNLNGFEMIIWSPLVIGTVPFWNGIVPFHSSLAVD